MVNKGVNLIIADLKNKLISDINESQLPISVVSLILDGLIHEVKIAEKNTLDKEQKEFTEANQNEVNEGGN